MKKAPEPVVETRKPSPTFSLFGAGGSPAKKASPPAPVVEKKQQSKAPAPSFGFFGGGSAAPKKTAPKKVAVADNIPVLSRFSQAADGSLTGIVSNSPNFRSGTRITTSPVPKGAKAGTVVKTSSGSQYRLE